MKYHNSTRVGVGSPNIQTTRASRGCVSNRMAFRWMRELCGPICTASSCGFYRTRARALYPGSVATCRKGKVHGASFVSSTPDLSLRAHHLLAASEPSKTALTARQCVVLIAGFGRALHTTMNAHTTIPNRQLYASKHAIRNMGLRITQPNIAANNTLAPIESLLPSLFDSLVSRETP